MITMLTALLQVTPPVTPPDPNDLNKFLGAVVDAIQHRQWQALAALALIGVVAFLRWVAPKVHGKTGEFLNSNRGGSLLVLLTGAVGAIATAMFAGKHVSANLVVAGVMTGVLASGGWNVVWDILSPSDKKEAKKPDINPKGAA